MTNLEQALLDEAKNTGKPVAEVLSELAAKCLFGSRDEELYVNGLEFGGALAKKGEAYERGEL